MSQKEKKENLEFKSPNMPSRIDQNKHDQFFKFMNSQKGTNKNLDLYVLFCAGFKSGYNYHRSTYGHLPKSETNIK